MATTTTLQIGKLPVRQVSAVKRRAQYLGLTPQEYLRQLIEHDLELENKAQKTTFSELMGPGREVDEAELDRLVDAARTRHHRRMNGSKR